MILWKWESLNHWIRLSSWKRKLKKGKNALKGAMNYKKEPKVLVVSSSKSLVLLKRKARLHIPKRKKSKRFLDKGQVENRKNL